MVDLDGDVSPLYSQRLGKYIDRDIVQFVPFNSVRNDPMLLAKKVLEEVPKQVTSYFQGIGVKPNPKKVDDKQDLIIKAKMKNQFANDMKVPDTYFQVQKAKMYNQLVQQGLDPNQVQLFLETHGMPDENPMWGAYINDPSYFNQLRFE